MVSEEIEIKKSSEISKMEIAGKVVAKVHKALREMIKPGVSLIELDKKARNIIRDNNCKPSFLNYGGFPATICASLNECVVHGIPNDYKLKEGDIISIDVGAEFKGYHGDAAFTVIVGENKDPDLVKFLEVTEQSLALGIKAAIPGARLGDVSNAIGTYIREHGYGIPQNYSGHGIGKKLHMAPYVQNEGQQGSGPELKAGMTLAIEPMAHIGSDETEVLEDN